MSIPLGTTTVTWASQAETEPGDGVTVATRAAGVRAHLSSPSGRNDAAPGGGTERVDKILTCDPVTGAAHTDRVTDDSTGDTYEVRWVTQREGLGLAHTAAGLVAVTHG